MRTMSDWDWEVRRAHDEGHVPCQECGHDITPGAGDHDENGCHCFDSHIDDTQCPCPLKLTDVEQARIWAAYRMEPYVLGLEVYWQGDPDDKGIVVAFSSRNMSIDVRWKDGVSKIDDPIQDLSMIPG